VSAVRASPLERVRDDRRRRGDSSSSVAPVPQTDLSFVWGQLGHRAAPLCDGQPDRHASQRAPPFLSCEPLNMWWARGGATCFEGLLVQYV